MAGEKLHLIEIKDPHLEGWEKKHQLNELLISAEAAGFQAQFFSTGKQEFI